MPIFLFGKPSVSENEFKRIKSSLRQKGLSRRDVKEVEKVFHGHIEEAEPSQKGIDKKEAEDGIKWLRENKDSHTLSDSQINTVEEELKKSI